MIQLLGHQEILKTLLLLTSDTGDDCAKNYSELRWRYLKFLREINSEDLAANFSVMPVGYISDVNLVAKNIEVFNCHSELNDIANTIQDTQVDRSKNYQWYQSVLDYSKMIYPAFYEIFNLSVGSIFNAKSDHAGGGTTSACIGVIWCDNRPSWQAIDQLEFFIHELTHTLLFLDERRFVHYRNLDEIVKEENFAYSAILNKQRPLDKVVHSIVVATEILLTRQNLLGHEHTFKLHPDSQTMKEECIKSIDAALAHAHLMESRAIELLKLCRVKLIDLEL